MKRKSLKLLQWLDQVAGDKNVNDFALRVAHSLAQNASLEFEFGITTIDGKSPGKDFIVIGEPSVSYSALADECRASKGGVRKAVKTLEECEHIRCTPAHSPARPASYALILRPRRADSRDGYDHAEVRRLNDGYDLIENMAVNPGKRRRYRLSEKPGKPFITPQEIEAGMSSTRRAALRDARMRDRKK